MYTTQENSFINILNGYEDRDYFRRVTTQNFYKIITKFYQVTVSIAKK